MAFSRVWPLGLTDGVSRLLAAALNQLDINQSRAVDGTSGGNYTPSAAVNFNGSGFGGVQTDTSLSGTYTFGTSGRQACPPTRVTITNANVTIRDLDAGSAGTLYLVDSSAATSTHTITVKASMAEPCVNGEVIRISFNIPSATHDIAVASEGGNSNPIYTSNNTATDFVDLMFDTSLTASNPQGEWTPVAYGIGTP